jgi:hypothetical protein
LLSKKPAQPWRCTIASPSEQALGPMNGPEHPA